ncbi:MAG: hypothetical protein AB8H86_20010 [Polyangiales bacterium]
MRTSLILLLLAGCSSCHQEPAPQTPSTSNETPEAPAPDYEVHEWGLINVAEEGAELAAGPGQPDLIQDLGMQGFGKPVLYFHLAEGSPDFDARVGVNLRSFLLGEHYPPAEGSGRTIHWEGHLAREACTAERTYPTAEECPVTQDGYCETAELAEYETPDHSCFHIGDAEWPLLFYRGVPGESRPPLPLTLNVDAGSATAIRSADAAETLGKVWYMVDQEVRAIVDWPAPGETVNLEGAAPTDPRASMHAELLEHGLTEEEAQAFGRAWYDELFGTQGGTLGLQGTGRGGGGVGEETIGLGNGVNGDTPGLVGRGGYFAVPAAVHRLVYWLPASQHDAMAELTFEPAPSVVRRATLVRDRASSR